MTTRQMRLRLRVGEGADYSDATIILANAYGETTEVVVYDCYTGGDGKTYLRVGLTLANGLYAASARDAGLSDEWLAERAADYQQTRAAISRPAGPGASGSYRKPPSEGNPAASSGRWRKPGGGKQPNHNGRRW